MKKPQCIFKARASQAGFTLVEVLAALLIFSLSIIGLIHAGTQSAKTAYILEEKMLAGIVADNQLVLARADDLSRGVRRGQDAMRGRVFNWELRTHNTDVDGFFRLSVQVSKAQQNNAQSRQNTGGSNQDQVLIERTAFVTGQPDVR